MTDNGWPLKSINDLKAPTNGSIAIGPFGSRMKSDCYVPSGVKVIRGTNISDTRALVGEMVCIKPELADQLGNAIVYADDLVFPHRGSIGLVGIVPHCCEERYVLSSSLMKLSCDRKQVDPLFLFYFFRSPEGKHELLKNASTVGTPGIGQPLSSLRSIKVPLPPLTKQKAIVAVFGALDDKIELNRRMNVTLEAMARALFQSWFVDFDPVRAKLDGRKPVGMDGATAALFPDSFEETALGSIPYGWEVKTLGEVIELAYGKPLKAEDRKNGPVCVYGANGPVGWHDEKLVSAPGIVVGRKGNPGVVTWAHGDFYPIDTTFYVDAIGTCRSLYFLYYALMLHNLGSLSADSAVPGLNRNHAYMSKQVIPSQPVLTAFDSQIAPIFAAIYANEEQSRTLATLRDTLLPKLLRGELNVEYAEK